MEEVFIGPTEPSEALQMLAHENANIAVRAKLNMAEANNKDVFDKEFPNNRNNNPVPPY
jgi:hypothetical protein